MNVASFKYKGENDNHMGFIAQEIEELYPELIKKDNNGYLSIKFLELIPLGGVSKFIYNDFNNDYFKVF
jgi:hypothetical protein